MKKDTALALAIVAFGTACYVAIGAEWPTPPPGMAYVIDLKPHSLVVTDVVLDGVAKTADLDGKRDKTDLTVYGEDVARPYALADECRPIEVTVNGTLYNLDKISLGWIEECLTVGMNVVTGELGDFYGDNMIVFFEDGVAKSLSTQWDSYPEWNLEYRFGGKPFKAGEWPRLKTGISPTADTLLKKSEVADVVRETKGMVWDAKLGVTWKQTMYDGNLYYIAVTNANITEVKE